MERIATGPVDKVDARQLSVTEVEYAQLSVDLNRTCLAADRVQRLTSTFDGRPKNLFPKSLVMRNFSWRNEQELF